MAACDQCDGIPGIYCPACNPAPTPPTIVDDPGPWNDPFPARYHGDCVSCDNPIDPGDLIQGRDTGDGDREYRHEGHHDA